MIKTYTKVIKYQSEEVCIRQGSRTLNGANFRHGFKNIASKIDRFTGHEEVDEFKGFCINDVGRIGFGQNGPNQDKVDQTGVSFENEIGEMSWVNLIVGVSELSQAMIPSFSSRQRSLGDSGEVKDVIQADSVRVNCVYFTWHSREITGPDFTVPRLAYVMART